MKAIGLPTNAIRISELDIRLCWMDPSFSKWERLLEAVTDLASLLIRVLPGYKRSTGNYFDVSELSFWTASTCCPTGASNVR
jgi:hypothetical protein